MTETDTNYVESLSAFAKRRSELEIIQGQTVVVFRDQTNKSFWTVIARLQGRLQIIKRSNLLILRDCVFTINHYTKRRNSSYHGHIKGTDISEELRDFGEGRPIRYWPAQDKHFVFRDDLSRIDFARYVVFNNREVIAFGGITYGTSKEDTVYRS